MFGISGLIGGRIANRPDPSYETPVNRAIRELFMSQRALSVSRMTGNKSTFAQWYQAVVREADMAEPSPVRGAMVIKPWGFGVWEEMQRDLDRLAELSPRLLVLQFGGAVGTLDQLGHKAQAVAARLAERLDLRLPDRSWHSQRDGIVELAGWLALVSGSLGKMGADIGLMAQTHVGEIVLGGGGTSSAMPHKQNPIGAEILVALARFNATLAGGMQQAMVHEQERSGAAWTLEWLLLPQMTMATAASLRTAATLLGNVIRSVLEANGIKTQDRLTLGGTPVVRKAITGGEIDIYPEYTGNAAFFFNRADDPAWKDLKKGYDLARKLDEDANRIIWLAPAPANNTWAIAVRKDVAADAKLRTMSDFGKWVAGGGQVKLAGSAEFVNSAAALQLPWW